MACFLSPLGAGRVQRRGLLLASVLLASGARAQQADVPPLLPDEPPPITRRYTAVTERPQPGYDTSGFQIGGLTVQPKLSVLASYDDNIYAQPNNGVGDAFTRFQPEISIGTNWGRNGIGLDARGTIDRYASRSTENIADYLLTGSGLYDIAHDTELRVALRAESGHLSRQSQDIFVQTVRPIAYTRQSGAVQLTQQFGQLAVEGKVQVVRTSVSNGLLPDGTIYVQDTSDNLDKRGSLKLTWSPTPSLGLFVSGLYDNRTFLIATPDTPKRNSDGYQFLGGVVFEPVALMRGTIGVGYIHQHFDNPLYRPIEGLAFSGKVQFFPTQLTTFTLSADRSVQDSGIPRSGAYLSSNVSLTVDHELLRQLILTFSAGLERNTYNSLDRRDTRITLAPSLLYKLNRVAQMTFSYNRLDQQSHGVDRYRPYTDNRVMIGLTLRR